MSESSATDRWDPPAFPPPESMPTASELESLQKTAYDEAYAAGREDGHSSGYAEGLKNAEHEVAARQALLESGLQAIASPLAELEETLEAQILQMVTQLVGRLFRRQLTLDPDSVIGLIRESVALLPAASAEVRVHVHPDDAQRLRELSMGGATEQQRWSLVEDPAVSRGGCRVEAGSSQIDARVQTRIEQLATELLGDERS